MTGFTIGTECLNFENVSSAMHARQRIFILILGSECFEFSLIESL